MLWRYFLNKDAHLNIQDQFGRTALHVAASTNSAGVIRALLENGGNHNRLLLISKEECV